MSQELDSINESAKAAQEVAKTASNAVDASRELGGFISRFISGSLEQGMGIVEDKLRYIRWERQQRLMQRAEQFLKERGLTKPDNSIPLKNAVALFEYATLEESDDLQDLWAHLLVNGTTKSTGISIERSFIEILAQISPVEAQILKVIYALPFEETQHAGVVTQHLPEYAIIAEGAPKTPYQDPSQEIKMALANLNRIGCLKFPLTLGGGEVFTQINPTLIGKELVFACSA